MRVEGDPHEGITEEEEHRRAQIVLSYSEHLAKPCAITEFIFDETMSKGQVRRITQERLDETRKNIYETGLSGYIDNVSVREGMS